MTESTTASRLSGTSASQLVHSHHKLKQSDLYLRGDQVLQKVIWVHDGCADRLAVKGETGGEERKDKANYEMVSLSAIVRIDRNNFWMSSDAGYQRPSTVWKDLVDVKPSCAVCTLDLQPAKGDYEKVVENLQQLQAQTLTPGYQMGKGFFLGLKSEAMRFKI